MKNSFIFLGLLILASIILINCSKDEIEIKQEKLLGKWVSLDKSDTLDFKTNTDFYKSNKQMVFDHYDYELFNDSIKIGYSGKMFILIVPSMHKYQLNNEILTIDFSNKQCYGFERERITYKKEKGIDS